MSQKQALWTVTAVAVMVLAGWQAARGDVDWLKQCIEVPNITDAVEQPRQKCGGLVDCSTATEEECSEASGTCWVHQGGVEVQVAIEAEDHRTTKVGDCTVDGATETDKCWHCESPTRMICYVNYRYQEYSDGDCLKRCERPLAFDAETGKCRP